MKNNQTRKLVKRALALFLAGWIALLPSAYAAELGPDQMTELLNNPGRSDADKARDEARKPAEIIAFAGIQPGMAVVDLMAASGWYTEVLSLAVGAEGRVYAQNPAFMLEFRDGFNDKALSTRLAGDRLPNVTRIDASLADAGIEKGSVDIAFTALNFHDTYYMAGEKAAADLLAQIHAVLKPRGCLLLIDHNGSPNQDNAKLHRIPRQIVVDMAAAAGLELAADGDMLAHPEDDGTQMVFMQSIRGKTDRFVLKLCRD